MKGVIYWFALILSFEIFVISLFELFGGDHNIVLPPSSAIVMIFLSISLVILGFSAIKLFKVYKSNIS